MLFACIFGDGFAGLWTSPGNLNIKAAILALSLLPLYFIASYIRFRLWVKKSERNLEAGKDLADDTGALVLEWVITAAASILFIVFVIGTFSAGGSSAGTKTIIQFVTFFIIVAIARAAALFVRDKLRERGKTGGNWIVFVVLVIIILILFALREFLLQ